MIESMTSESPARRERPLSPHLQIYKPQMTTVLSILHRMTGAALAIGSVLIMAVLMAAATGEEAYNKIMGFLESPLGLFLLFGWSVALVYHSLNGIRHLFWDMGYLFKIKNAETAGKVVLAGTVILTILIWCTA